tara:strand:+ start:27043 stop:27999 length:957 start_codon:yes stop_codon:yes gene_type:complete
MKKHGNLIISLDFEIRWGAAEKWDIEKKRKYFIDSRKSISEVLKIFSENNICATWATVGFLFAENKEQLIRYSPELKPTYLNSKLCYYDYFSAIGNNEYEDPLHYAGNIIKQIINTEGQELGTHTFSHYYCNEKGQTARQFDQDLKAAQKIAKKNFNVNLKSLVFPRNQFNRKYLDIAIDNGIKVVRTNPDVWFWKKNNFAFLNPVFRGIDTIIPISSSLTFDFISKYKSLSLLPSSRFFRPYKFSEICLQNLKIDRIKKEMYFAAKNKLNYHLWWHPHNFGENVNKNLMQLKEIIVYFKYLQKKYSFRSSNMINFDL